MRSPRKLAPHRRRPEARSFTTTRPGSLLTQHIPVRTFAQWDDRQPGFVEIDLVAHCGESPRGEFVYTLGLVDVASGLAGLPRLPRTLNVRFKSRRRDAEAFAGQLATAVLPADPLRLPSAASHPSFVQVDVWADLWPGWQQQQSSWLAWMDDPIVVRQVAPPI